MEAIMPNIWSISPNIARYISTTLCSLAVIWNFFNAVISSDSPYFLVFVFVLVFNLAVVILNVVLWVTEAQSQKTVNTLLHHLGYTQEVSAEPSFLPGDKHPFRGIVLNNVFYSTGNTGEKYEISNLEITQWVTAYIFCFPGEENPSNFCIIYNKFYGTDQPNAVHIYIRSQ